MTRWSGPLMAWLRAGLGRSRLKRAAWLLRSPWSHLSPQPALSPSSHLSSWSALLLLSVVSTLGASKAHGAEVMVAVAANFAAPMQAIAKAFGQATGHQAVLVPGATAKFYAQVRHGAPFQVLLAADRETPAKLEAQGLGVAGSRFTYATGRLALWSAQRGVVDAQGAVLRVGTFERLVLADAKLAPYGAAALQTLQALGLLPTLQSRLVMGDSVAQAHGFIASGNASLGFVALSQIMLDGQLLQGSAWTVPQTLHAPLHQDALLLMPGRTQPAALALMQYLRGDAARRIMRRYGYEH